MSMRHRWILLATLAALPACDSCSSKSSSPSPLKPAANATAGAGTTPASPAGTGAPTMTAHPVSAAEEREWVEGEELVLELAELMEKKAGNCDELATTIEAWTAEHEEALARYVTRDDRISKGARETLSARDGERHRKADRIIDKALASCEDHPRVKKAMKALPSEE